MKLHTPAPDSISVPIIFFDRYMPEANGEFVKVYLSLYSRCARTASHLTLTELADTLYMTERDIVRALRYWESRNLLHILWQDESPEEISFRFPHAEASMPVSAPVAATKEPKTDMKSLAKDQDFSRILFVAERLLKKTLSASDTEKLASWYRLYPGKPEVIEYLIEYCAEQGHTKFPYIEKVILSWHSQGLATLPDIQAYLKIRNQKVYTVMKEFGIQSRLPGTKESAYIDKWYNDYGFTVDMVSLACQKTLTAIRQPSFEYADRILSYWKQQNAMTRTSVQALDAAHREKGAAVPQNQQTAKPAPKKSRFHNFEERKVDYDQLEDALSFDYYGE